MHHEFSTIESSLEFIHLLRAEIAETSADVHRDMEDAGSRSEQRRAEALRIVEYKLQLLENYMSKSERLLRDLRRLRTLILEGAERAVSAATD